MRAFWGMSKDGLSLRGLLFSFLTVGSLTKQHFRDVNLVNTALSILALKRFSWALGYAGNCLRGTTPFPPYFLIGGVCV